jgi:hypothetical protein
MHGEKIDIPETPFNEDYDFGGWFTNIETSGNAWDFDTEIIESFTLYAKWISRPPTHIELSRISETHPPIKLYATELFKIHTGDIIILEADIFPSNATNKNVVWHSDAPNVVSINNGILVARDVGIASIFVTSQENENIMTQINIKVYHPTGNNVRYQPVPSPYFGRDRVRYSYSHGGNDVFFIHLGELSFIPTYTYPIYEHTETFEHILRITKTDTFNVSVEESVTNNRKETLSNIESTTKSTTGDNLGSSLINKGWTTFKRYCRHY